MSDTSPNKQLVQRYMDLYQRADKSLVLDLLTDDVEWIIAGHARRFGKAEFAAEMDAPDADGPPRITIERLIAQGDAVVAEGAVSQPIKSGGTLELIFCDVFDFRAGRISRLSSYFAPSV